MKGFEGFLLLIIVVVLHLFVTSVLIIDSLWNMNFGLAGFVIGISFLLEWLLSVVVPLHLACGGAAKVLSTSWVKGKVPSSIVTKGPYVSIVSGRGPSAPRKINKRPSSVFFLW